LRPLQLTITWAMPDEGRDLLMLASLKLL
jgi:hypothetical protein